jgi:hypothetical protein
LDLRLKYAPIPANAPLFAADIAQSAFEVHRIDLDYRPGSLTDVDRIIEGFRSEGLTPDQIGETLFGFGCYVGEVFVRHAGGAWRATEETSMRDVAGGPFVIELPDGGHVRFVNPLDKVFKRLENGPEDDLPSFFRLSRCPRVRPTPGEVPGQIPSHKRHGSGTDVTNQDPCRCLERSEVLGIAESEAYSRHLMCEWMGAYVGRYRCPDSGVLWKRVWGVGTGHGYGPARLEVVQSGDEATAFRNAT